MTERGSNSILRSAAALGLVAIIGTALLTGYTTSLQSESPSRRGGWCWSNWDRFVRPDHTTMAAG